MSLTFVFSPGLHSFFLFAGSAKACFGHTEGAAGAHGALAAAITLKQGSVPPMMHCRVLNPHVAFAFEEWRQAAHSILSMVGRTAAVWPRSLGVLAGCSSFGMSGVNAHALIALPHDDGCNLDREIAWRQRLHWPIPEAHHLLGSAFTAAGSDVGARCTRLALLPGVAKYCLSCRNAYPDKLICRPNAQVSRVLGVCGSRIFARPRGARY